MKNELAATLTTISEEVLEKFAFVFIDESGDECKPDISDWDCIGAKLSFYGTHSGSIHLWFSRNLAKSIAANMLALEEPADDKKAEDGVKELTNIITGHFITTAFENSDIHLSIPEPCSFTDLKTDADHPCASWYLTDDENILVLIDIS
jgi:CheY-specific phosphatase CheX